MKKSFTLEEAEEALALAVREGIISPFTANEWTEEKLLAWYEREMDEKKREDLL